MGLVRDLHIDAFSITPRKGNTAGIVLKWGNFTERVCIATLGTAVYVKEIHIEID